MDSLKQAIEDNPREALKGFIQELETDYYHWYDTSAKRGERLWQSLWYVSLVSGYGTSILAAVLKDDYFKGYAWGRVLLIVLPFVGAFASTVLVQTRARWKLREDGRRAIKAMADEGRRRLAEAASTLPKVPLSEFSRIHEDLQKKRDELEEIQSKSFFESISKDRDTTS